MKRSIAVPELAVAVAVDKAVDMVPGKVPSWQPDTATLMAIQLD